MIFIASFLGLISLFIIFYSLLKLLFKGRLDIISRLDSIKLREENKENLDELDTPFLERVLKPIGSNLSKLVLRAAPKGIKKRISKKIDMAGNPFNIGVNGWFFLKVLFTLIIPSIFFAGVLMGDGISLKRVGMGIIILIISYYLPNFLLIYLIKKRQKEMTNSLPDVLDLLTVSVEAGLSFDGALSRLINKMEGHLAKEFSRVLNEMKMGKNRKESLRDMSLRCGISDLTSFVGSIIQAEELGVGITNVLRIQSKQMRIKRRQRAQEKAMKAPIKMLFPLIIFIFPTIFTVLLGPAVIRVIQQLGK